MKILADVDLPYLSQLFPKPFEVTTYDSYQSLLSMLPFHNILICRSTLRVNETLLAQSNIQCVATASSGTDHIDQHYLNSKQIHLFDAKGCNAQAVADYVTATLAWLEKHNKITGNCAGIIGIGAVGSQVLKRLYLAGYIVQSYDPYKTPIDNQHQVNSLQALTHCDVLCIHANLHQQLPYPSLNLINAEFLSRLKPDATIINASRGGIINENDLLQLKQPITYCTDVFLHEPDINPNIVDLATLCTPHIAGHSIEAKQNAMIQLSVQLHAYFNLNPPIQLTQQTESLNYFHRVQPWQDLILGLYNPYDDTQIIKNALDKKNAFITQRKAHTQRHDFAVSEPLFA